MMGIDNKAYTRSIFPSASAKFIMQQMEWAPIELKEQHLWRV
jgi:hypothetical protein